MTTNPNENKRQSAHALRARLEVLAAKPVTVEEWADRIDRLADWTTAKIALNQFPHHYQPVMRILQEFGLLAKAKIDYVDRDLRRIDFAWVEKRIGLRVIPLPVFALDKRIPDFLLNDAALREQGWLILTVDSCSPTMKDQVQRAALVIKRIGASTKTAR